MLYFFFMPSLSLYPSPPNPACLVCTPSKLTATNLSIRLQTSPSFTDVLTLTATKKKQTQKKKLKKKQKTKDDKTDLKIYF